jgi:hypothetical protein
MSDSNLWNGDAPVIVRIAGLPAPIMDAFGSEICSASLQEEAHLRHQLERCRVKLIHRLQAVIPNSPPPLRRLLLDVKRDSFNQRRLARHRSSSCWPELERIAGPLVQEIVELEEQIAGWEKTFDGLYQVEHERQKRALSTMIENPVFLRGLSLASPLLARSRSRLGCQPERKERKLRESLARYISRAALKLSPFSTFTRLALGVVCPDMERAIIRLVGAHWHEISLLRLKRYLLDQYCQALLQYPPFTDKLPVALNDTVEEIAPNRFRFHMHGSRRLDEKSGKMRYFPPALVKVELSPSRLAQIQAALAGSPTNLRTFVERLEQLSPELAGPETAQLISKLLQIGLLRSILPWPSNEVHLERRMLDHLRSLPRNPRLDIVIEGLESIVALEAGYSSTSTPDESVDQIDRLLGPIWESLTALGQLGGTAEYARGKRIDLFEDVFLLASSDARRPELVQISEAAARDVLETMEPVNKLSVLYSWRYDFLSSLSALAARTWPGPREMGVIEVFSSIQPLWREYLQRIAANRGKRKRETFNPLELPHLDELAQVRGRIWEEVVRSVRSENGESRIDRHALATALKDIPEHCRPLVGPCLFLQPTGQDLWVVNGLFEGTGRYSSRYTTVMPHELCYRYTRHLAACSRLEQNGEAAELLDLMCTQGDTLNLHYAQTPHVLEIPGETAAVPNDSKLLIGDLRIRFSGDPSTLPYLVDTRGRHYLPVHLGGTNLRYMPVLLKFLSLFGPGDLKPIVPPPGSRTLCDTTVLERLKIGNLILRRKRWIFPAKPVLDSLNGLSEAQAYATVNRWRSNLGIPDHAFVIEKVPHEYMDELYKPQYIDFTSPLFAAIFRSILAGGQEQISLDEMLPSPVDFPVDGEGVRWGVEVQLDSLVLKASSTQTVAENPWALIPTSMGTL